MSVPIREAHAQSLAGVLIWLPTMVWLKPGWSPALLAFGPLVLYPLLLDMLGECSLRRLALPAFLPALASYALEQGTIAGALALPWLAFAIVLFLRNATTRTISINVVITGYLIVGAGWLVLARLGERPLEYEHAIVHATAVHFHYAGFVLPILALNWLHAAPSRFRYVVLTALLLGVPLVAAGITLSAFQIHWPELIAVWFFAAACIVFAVAQIRLAAHWLLVISSASLIAAMCLALVYGTRNYLPADWLDIPLMLRTHGPIQVFGFALPGALAWAMMNEKAKTSAAEN